MSGSIRNIIAGGLMYCERDFDTILKLNSTIQNWFIRWELFTLININSGHLATNILAIKIGSLNP
jgi:hypothetical protein